MKKKQNEKLIYLLLAVPLLFLVLLNCGKDKSTEDTKDTEELSIEWVKVEGGSFKMGSNSGDSYEKPVHSVYLNTYYISKYEVTVGQFREFVNDTGYRTDAEKGGGGYIFIDRRWQKKPDANWQNPYFSQSNDHPVVLVSWNDAKAFCNWLSKKTGKNIHLPTEAQWEYAARGGNKSRGYKYSGSNNIDSVAWNSENAGHETHPVGKKKPNELGIYDMSCNVWEWCSDWYDKNYYKNSPYRNPGGPSTGSNRVQRGGSWLSYGRNMRLDYRDHDSPSIRISSLGFRLCQD